MNDTKCHLCGKGPEHESQCPNHPLKILNLQQNKAMTVAEEILRAMDKMSPENKQIFLLNAIDMARKSGYNEGIKQAGAIKDTVIALQQLKDMFEKNKNDITDKK